MVVKFTKSASKSIRLLDVSTRQKIKNAIDKLPFGDVKRLQGYKNLYRLRVGKLRVVYKIENEVLSIREVLPRGQAYKNL